MILDDHSNVKNKIPYFIWDSEVTTVISLTIKFISIFSTIEMQILWEINFRCSWYSIYKCDGFVGYTFRC